jgi:hypothetical protein
MPYHPEDLLYRCCRILRRRRASRPDANHIRFVLDYQAWLRSEPGTDRDEIALFSRPAHLALEDASEWARWDLPIRAIIETLSQRFPEVAESEATMPRLVPDHRLERHEWDNTEYRGAEQHLQRYLSLVGHLGDVDEATAKAFAEQLDPGDAEWVLFTLRETRYWLVHLLQSVATRLMPPEFLRSLGDHTPPATDNLQN